MKKVIAFAVDNSLKYQRLLLASIVSFRRYNPDPYPIRVYCVNVGQDFRDHLGRIGCEVRQSPRTTPLLPHSYFPCAAAKCHALADTTLDELVLLLDVDGLILANINPLAEEFLASSAQIGMRAEDDKRGNVSSVKECWFDCPLHEFKDSASWMDKPILNSGMILAHGEVAQAVGREALRIVEKYPQTLYLGEQGPINGVVYGEGYKMFPLQSYHHCLFTSEEHLSYRKEFPYLEEVRVDGQPLVYRHFGNRYIKEYQMAVDYLLRPTN